MPVTIPPGLLAQRALDDDWGRWLDRLPRLAADLLAEWRLRPTGTSLHGFCSLVLPVLDADGTAGALKIGFDGDEESLHEGLTLQHWGGRGAGRLHIPAMPQLAHLSSYVERWLRERDEQGRDLPVPRRYVEQALSLGPDLLADDATPVVVHGDLHYANVLADGTGEWLAIDPKPMAGDPHYEPAPMLWNRMDELGGPPAVGSVRDGLRRRFHALVDAAGLDEARARDWVVVRMVLNAGWAVQDAQRAGRRLTAEEQDWITRCIAVTKAVQD